MMATAGHDPEASSQGHYEHLLRCVWGRYHVERSSADAHTHCLHCHKDDYQVFPDISGGPYFQ